MKGYKYSKEDTIIFSVLDFNSRICLLMFLIVVKHDDGVLSIISLGSEDGNSDTLNSVRAFISQD